ncbi:MAG: integrase family protein [Rhodoferax sp.]|nr:integrase family protein [Rhodoferax sp.]
MYFDARAAKLLAPGGHIVVDGCPGLRLEASTAGRAWTYRYKSPVDGRMRQIKIGKWPAMSIGQATTAWQVLKDQRDAGLDPAQLKKAQRKVAAQGVYTVADMVADYYTGHLLTQRKPVGAKAVNARLVVAIADVSTEPADSLTRRQVFDLVDTLSGTPVAAKSVRNEMGAAMALALDAGRVPEDSPNWWRQIMPGKLRSKGALREGKHKGTGKRVLSERELHLLDQVDMPLLSDAVRDVLTLYLWTMARGGELVQLHAQHITEEPDGLWWTCPKEWIKTARHEKAFDYRVPLIGRAKEVVQRRLAVHKGYLFPAKTETGHVSQPAIQSQVHFRQPYSNSRLDVQRIRLTVTHWSPHDLRRTARTMIAALGCPNEIGEALLGHVQPGVGGIYNKYQYDAERRDWLQRWDQRLNALLPS